MKFSVNDCITINTGINALLLCDCTPTVARRAHRNQLALLNELKAFEAERSKLVEKSTAKDADGKPVPAGEGAVKLTDPAAFQAELQELLDDEVSVDLQTIRVDKLPDVLKGVIVAQLDKILEDVEETK